MQSEKIGSEELVEQLPMSLKRLISLERFYLHKLESVQDISADPTFDTRYFPQNCGAFRLPCFWVPRGHLYVYGDQTAGLEELRMFSGGGLSERVLFPIHPLVIGRYQEFLASAGARNAGEDGLCIWAMPTSSTRTLLAWPDQEPGKALFIKTTLPSRALGDRLIRTAQVGRSVGHTMLLNESSLSLPKAFSHLPESVGFVPRRMLDSGVIVRSIPQEIKDGRILAAPLFSLLGGTNGYRPLFLTIMERSGMEPRRLLEDVLCGPGCG